MKPSHFLPCVALAALLGTGMPAMAEKKFINRSEFLICLQADPDHPPTNEITVTPGAGSEFREPADPSEATTLREETKAAGARNAPIALVKLPRNPLDTLLFMEPGGSVSFSAAAGGALDPGQAHEIRFKVCTASLGAAGGWVLTNELLAVGFMVQPSLDGQVLESLTCRRYRPKGAKPGWSGHSFTFQTPDSDDPALRLVDRIERSGCSIQ